MRRSTTVVLLLVLAVMAFAWLRLVPERGRPATVPPVATPQNSEALTLSRAPSLAAMPSTPQETLRIERRGDHFAPVQPEVVHDPRSHWSNPAKPVLPDFPLNFAAPVRVTSGSASVFARPLQARAASMGTLRADGTLVYEDAFDGCDVSYRCAPFKTEEFITVKAAHSAMSWAWELETHGLQPRLTPAHTIELCDDAGVPRLRINAPEGKDAAGAPLRVGERLTLMLEGNRVSLTADLRECALPVVIDPSWSSTGTLAFPRWRHTATLLSNGTVLVTGGQFGANMSFTTCEIFDSKTQTWRSTNSLPVPRHFHAAARLTNGKVLVVGGSNYSQPFVAVDMSANVFDPTSETWSSAAGLISSHQYGHSLNVLSDGRVLLVGGEGSAPASSTDAEIIDATASGTWMNANPLQVPHSGHFACVLSSGDLFVAGGRNDSNQPNVDCEIFNPNTGQWTITQPMPNSNSSGATGTSPGAVLINGSILMSGGDTAPQGSQLYNPSTGQWTVTSGPVIPRTNHSMTNLVGGGALMVGGFTLNGTAELAKCEIFDGEKNQYAQTASLNTARSDATLTNLPDGRILVTGEMNSAITSCEIFDPNTVPTISASEPSSIALEGQTLLFYSTIFNPDGYAINYLWNFGDGTSSTDPNPNHAYTTAGVYAASVTITGVTPIAGPFSITSNSITIHVFRDSDRPTARFVSNTLTGYVGQPIGYDASFSTDPKNNIVSYDWDFGDGSPHGSQQIISRVYAAEGTYTVRLTITDGDGLTDSTTLTMVVLPAVQAGLFNSNIKYSVNWNRAATNADTLNLSATLNVGNATVSDTTPLALSIVGQTFTGTSATKLALLKTTTTGPQVKWSVKKVTKKGAPQGTYALTASVKHASLGQAFALAGVIGTTNASAKIPIRLGVGASSFSSGISSSFRFGSKGLKASGGGAGPN